MLPPGDGIEASDWMWVDTVKFNQKADTLRSTCVDRRGSGGWFHPVEECKDFR